MESHQSKIVKHISKLNCQFTNAHSVGPVLLERDTTNRLGYEIGPVVRTTNRHDPYHILVYVVLDKEPPPMDVTSACSRSTVFGDQSCRSAVHQNRDDPFEPDLHFFEYVEESEDIAYRSAESKKLRHRRR